MEVFTNQAGSRIVLQVIHTIQKQKVYLSEIDGAAGDGDHGINMSKGMTFAEETLEQMEGFNMSQGFLTISNILVSKIGGSMGPLYGSFFRGLSVASKKEETIDKTIMATMLQKAYSNLSMLTEAKVGDKTLIDVLVPAITAYEKTMEENGSFADCLQEMLKAAEQGLESTKNMVAKIGRSSRLGERSLGHQDAGATSCYLILKAMAETELALLQA